MLSTLEKLEKTSFSVNKETATRKSIDAKPQGPPPSSVINHGTGRTDGTIMIFQTFNMPQSIL